MPKKLHAELEKRAKEMGLTGERKDAYVYGTMQKVEKDMHGNKKKGKKKSMMGGGYGK